MVLDNYPSVKDSQETCDICKMDLGEFGLVVKDNKGNVVAICCSIPCCDAARADHIWYKVVDGILEDLS